MDEIEKAINDDKEKSGQSGATGPAEKPTEEEARKAQALADLKVIEDAKAAALADLQKARADKRAVKKSQSQTGPEPEKEKVIDENDPDSKPWLKRINDSVAPVQEELEREKAENRQLAMDHFMAARPALAKNPEKLKELMRIYDQTHTATEKNVDAIVRDLDKAYAYVYKDELLEAAQQRKIGEARRDAIFSDPAVSRGSTTYMAPKESAPKLTAEEERVLAKWNMSPQEWTKMKLEQDKKRDEESV